MPGPAVKENAMRLRLTAITLSVLLTAAAAWAGPVEPGLVSADAKWVAHLDVKALLKSPVGELLLEKLREEPTRTELADFVSVFGFDPRHDLQAVTLWGTGYEPDEGVVALTGKFDKDKLLGLLAQNEHYKQFEHGDYVLHRWRQEPEGRKDDGIRFGTFFRKDVALVTRDKEMLAGALDQLAKEGGTLAGRDAPALLPELSEGTFLFAKGVDLAAAAKTKRKADARWMKLLSSGLMELGQTGQTLFVVTRLNTINAENGARLRETLTGLRAMAQLHLAAAEEKDRPLPPWAPLLDAIRIGGEGEVATVRMEMEQSAAVEMAEQMRRARPADRRAAPEE
jgi:hypothetical protein